MDARSGWTAVGAACARVAEAPVWAMADADLLAALRADQAAQAQLLAGRLAVVRELSARGVAPGTGAHSVTSLLVTELRIDPAEAARMVAAAAAFDPAGDAPLEPGAMAPSADPAIPVLAEVGKALAKGAISVGKAEAVRSVATGFLRSMSTQVTRSQREELVRQAQDFLLEHAGPLVPGDLRGLGRRMRAAVDPDGLAGQDRRDAANDCLTLRTHPTTGRVAGRFEVDAVTGAQLVAFVQAHAAPRQSRDEQGRGCRDPRTPDQRRAHAFGDLIRLAANADRTVHGGLSPKLIITARADTLLDGGRGCAEAETGALLSPAQARHAGCDASVLCAVVGARGEVLDLGREQRTVSPAQRRALHVRDRACRFPGCGRPPRWCDAHHVEHWADGGRTDLGNLVLLCAYHHGVVHHTAWTVTMIDAQPVFTPPPPGSSDHWTPRGPTAG